MNSKLDARVKAMEAERSNDNDDAFRAADAEQFTDRILALANRFSESDAAVPAGKRLSQFSAAGRLAWALRFGSKEECAAMTAEMKGFP